MTDVRTELVAANVALSPLGGVSLAGFIRDSAGVPAEPMRVYGKYAMVYLLHGHGRYSDANGLSQPVRPGDLILVFPDVAHSYRPSPGERWDEFYIVFDGPVFDAWRRGGLLSPARPVLHLEPIAYWLRRLVTAAGTGNGGDTDQAIADAVRVQQFLADALAAQNRQQAGDADRQWLAKAKAFLEGHVETVGRIEQTFGVAAETFRK
ncbi:MAG TPA: AraC family ligand binding domain-containing protein, partial [Tepidisphaeraceae bacterium]|nr:AraC family ligand binding domain-containing protein [Tepidisphaeraceae bacterium]